MPKAFFYMHKSDRRLMLALLAVAAVVVAAIGIAGGKGRPDADAVAVPADSARQQSAPLLTAPDAADAAASEVPASAAAERFAFDPNTADSAELRRLGLSSYIAGNIMRYRAAGGVFTTKADFARLYGLTVKEYRELEPYISIGADYRPAASLFPQRAAHHRAQPMPAASRDTSLQTTASAMPTQRTSFKLQPGETIDLASADTTTLMRIPGIGPYYARRIAEYGQRLGGYVSIDQLDEIDDFPSEAKQYITLSQPRQHRININSATLQQLRRHPYINFYMARAITDYRRQHGPITSLSDLRLLQPFTDEDIRRIEPYIDY